MIPGRLKRIPLSDRRVLIRLCFTSIIVLAGGFLVTSSVTTSYAVTAPAGSDGTPTNGRSQGSLLDYGNRSTFSDLRPNEVTVLSVQQTPHTDSKLAAVDMDGNVVYFNDSYTQYMDIDPVPAGRWTVMYVANERLNESECSAVTSCRRIVVERVNISTGETDLLYSQTRPEYDKQFTATEQWHDIDRINSSHILVADISRDNVFIVNTSSGVITWQWEAQNDFPIAGGGRYPYDWTHVNDVELLDDGRIMVSLRNQDQVVFINRTSGLVEGWTLGSDDEYGTLYEQHNPDYIPPEMGGPAVVVADSQNNRIVEYQRVDGRWVQSWVWKDGQLAWPRDADRLPNGNTLIADTAGDRVLEINRRGNIAWQLDVRALYDAERLGTGDESEGGQSAESLDLQSTRRGASDGTTEVTDSTESESTTTHSGSSDGTSRGITLRKLLNALLFVVPRWVDVAQLVSLVLFTGGISGWLVTEYHWANLSLEIQWPFYLK